MWIFFFLNPAECLRNRVAVTSHGMFFLWLYRVGYFCLHCPVFWFDILETFLERLVIKGQISSDWLVCFVYLVVSMCGRQGRKCRKIALGLCEVQGQAYLTLDMLKIHSLVSHGPRPFWTTLTSPSIFCFFSDWCFIDNLPPNRRVLFSA